MSATRYDPKIYEIFFSDRNQDLDWYVSLARSTGGPVLELGVGTGRTLIPVAQSGIEVTGIDISRDMLSFVERKVESAPIEVRQRITLAQGDMISFSKPSSFRQVQIPFRAFLHNLDRNSQLECLRQCYKNLVPGGILSFDIFHPSLEFMTNSSGQFAGCWRLSDERLLGDGGVVLLSETTEFDTTRQKLRTWHRYDTYGGDGIYLSGYSQLLELAYLYPGDVRSLLFETGFSAVHLYGDFLKAPVGEGEEIVVLAKREN